MNDPVLDHLEDIDSMPESSWSKTALWALLLLTGGANLLIFYGLGFITPHLMKQMQEGLRTVGEVVAIVIEIRKAIYLLLAVTVSVWWGRLLAKNQELSGWQVLLVAFGVGVLSSCTRLLISVFSVGIENVYNARALNLFFFIFESATFALIVFATTSYRSGKGRLPGLIAYGITAALILLSYGLKNRL